MLDRNTWHHLNDYKCYQQNVFTNRIYSIYMYKED